MFMAFKGQKKGLLTAVPNSFYDFTLEPMIYLWRVKNSC